MADELPSLHALIRSDISSERARHLTVLHVPVLLEQRDRSTVPRILTGLPRNIGESQWVCDVAGETVCCSRVRLPLQT